MKHGTKLQQLKDGLKPLKNRFINPVSPFKRHNLIDVFKRKCGVDLSKKPGE